MVHFVTLIYVLDHAGQVVAMENLDPSGVDRAVLTFRVPRGALSLTAYEWCNKHGLWQGPTVRLVTVPLLRPLGPRIGDPASSQYCPTFHADFSRRQAAEPFDSQAPFNETHGAKHTPYITISGTTGMVKVGSGSPYHPMVASSDPDTVHFITHIY